MITSLATALAMTSALTLGVPMALDPQNPPTIGYWARHPLHTIAGTSHSATGAADVRSDGSCDVQMRVRLDSFASGRASADRNLLEAFDAKAFPTVEVKAVIPPHPRPPLAEDGTGIEDVDAHFLVTLHGVSQQMEGRVWIYYQYDSSISVSGDIAIELTDYHLSRPTFLFLPVKNVTPVHFDVAWRAEPGILPSVASSNGGGNGSAWLRPEGAPPPPASSEPVPAVPTVDHVEFVAPTK